MVNIDNDSILKWVNDQPFWVRKAVLIYCETGIINEKNIGLLAELCISEAKKEKIENCDTENQNLIGRKNCKGFSVKSISNVIGVNAIDTNRPLNFSPKGITVVYGNNGSGKSGYIRIFKMASGAKYREEIKNNVYIDKKVHPSCTIELEYDEGENIQVECDLSKIGESEQLRNIDIFDTKISMAYVNEAKEASYEPWIFGLFATLANTASIIKLYLERKKKIIEVFPFPEELKDTMAYKRLEDISYNSKITDFSSKWKDEEELAILTAKCQVDTNVALISKKETEIRNIESLVKYLQTFSLYFGEESQKVIEELRVQWDRSVEDKKATEVLFMSDADDIEKTSISSRSWINLWKSAQEYYNDVLLRRDIPKYIEKGGVCPLCRQAVDDKVAGKMKKIDDYLNGQASTKEKESKRIYLEKLNNIPAIKSQLDIENLIGNIDVDEDSKKNILEINGKISEYMVCMREEKYSSLSEHMVDLTTCISTLEVQKQNKEMNRDEYKKLIDTDEQIELQKKTREMRGEKNLTEVFCIIEKNIELLEMNNILDKAIKFTATNRITLKSKELAGEIITDEYIRRFNEELMQLTGNSISVKLAQQKAGKGKTPYKVVLCDAKGEGLSPQDILSEGENRVVSLAAFFAEAAGREEKCPLIVDDPISSLDYDYEQKVIDKLIDIAKQRQVIVFTHRISMAVGINENICKDDCNIGYSEITIRASRNRKGVPDESSNYKGKSLNQLKYLNNSDIKQLMNMDDLTKEYTEKLYFVCQQIRILVEKSVEDLLLNGVVKRFRKDVQTQRIELLATISEEDCKLIDKMMTKYSYYDHSIAEETPMVNFTPTEIQDDVNEMIVWMTARNKLINKN